MTAEEALENILAYVRGKDDLYANGAIRQFAEEGLAAAPAPEASDDPIGEALGELSQHLRRSVVEAVDALRKLEGKEPSIDQWWGIVAMGLFRAAALAASPEAREALSTRDTLTDERIDRIADFVVRGMEDGLRGFQKVWGWQQFARALADVLAAPAQVEAREALTYEVAQAIAMNAHKDAAEMAGDPDFVVPMPADWIVMAVMSGNRWRAAPTTTGGAE